MKKKLTYRFLFAFFILCLILLQLTSYGQKADPKLVEKYGLVIPPDPGDKLEPAPEWIQKADMFGGGRYIDHKFFLKDTVMTRIVRIRAGNGPLQITEHYPVETVGGLEVEKGALLLSHVPHARRSFEEAHKQGVKAIPYLHFTDIHSFYADQDVFMFEHPEVLLKDEKAKWMHIPMDGSDRAFRFLTCANSPYYWKSSLAYVKKMMDWGADGIFIDNVGNRQPCFADKHNVRNPEFLPFVHEHLFPDADHNYAWDKLLQAIRILVKSYGDDKIVLLNSGIGTQFQKNGDACMWESFIYSWAWEGRRHTWDDVKKRAKENEWFLNTGRRIDALSTINRSGKTAKDDAFWAFSAARLVDFIWAGGLNGTGAEVLYETKMGKGLEPFKEINKVAYRVYENGLIVLNDSDKDQTIEIVLPAISKAKQVKDLFNNNQIISVRSKKIKVTVPKKCARVYHI